MNKKPEIFKPEVGNINNNKKSYYSFLDDKLNIEREVKTPESPIDFINNLSKSGSYIFGKDVVIITKTGRYETRIAGKLGNRIITMDNKSININEIIKIYQKEQKTS